MDSYPISVRYPENGDRFGQPIKKHGEDCTRCGASYDWINQSKRQRGWLLCNECYANKLAYKRVLQARSSASLEWTATEPNISKPDYRSIDNFWFGYYLACGGLEVIPAGYGSFGKTACQNMMHAEEVAVKYGGPWWSDATWRALLARSLFNHNGWKPHSQRYVVTPRDQFPWWLMNSLSHVNKPLPRINFTCYGDVIATKEILSGFPAFVNGFTAKHQNYERKPNTSRSFTHLKTLTNKIADIGSDKRLTESFGNSCGVDR